MAKLTDYRPFKKNTPRLRKGGVIEGKPYNYGMVLVKREQAVSA